MTSVVGSGFSNPIGVAVDRNGNIYVADANTYTVKEVMAVQGAIPAANPTINTIASGFQGEFGVAVDASGNVYVANPVANTVSEVVAINGSIPASPTIRTLGSGFNFPIGVAVDGSGNVYVADQNNYAVKEIVAVNGVIPAANPVINIIATGFNTPVGVAVDGSGNVYVSDSGAGTVSEIVASGGSVSSSSTVKTIVSGFGGATGVAVDSSGNVYVSVQGSNMVYEIVAVNGNIPQSPAIRNLGPRFGGPAGVAVDSNGNVYVGDAGSNALKEIAPSVSFGSTSLGSTSLVQSLTFNFTTSGNGVSVAALTQGASGLDFADAGTGSCTTNGTSYSYPAGSSCTIDVTFRPTFSGTRSGAVQLTNSAGTVIASAAVYGIGSGPQVVFNPGVLTTVANGFPGPANAAVDGAGNIYVVDKNQGTVTKIAPGCTSASCGTQMGGGFGSMFGIAIDGAGNIYVPDNSNSAVFEIPPTCTSSSCVITLGGGFNQPTGVAVSGNGNVYVDDWGNNQIKMMPAGCTSPSCVTNLGGSFSNPNGIAVDANGNVYVAIFNSALVQEIPAGCTAGVYQANNCTVATLGAGAFNSPNDVAVDSIGNIYVADNGAGAITVMPQGCSSSSCVTTLKAGFSAPNGLSLDGAGNIYIGNTGAGAVSELARVSAAPLSFATSTQVDTTDTTDGPQTLTLQNVGNQPLTLTPPTSGNNPSIPAGFTLDASSTCSSLSTTSTAVAQLNAGSSCTYAVDFAPTSDGVLNSSLVLTDNNLAAFSAVPAITQTQSFSLAGTGTGSPTIVVSGTVPAAAPNVAYVGATFTASGGYGPYSFSATGLPAGMSLGAAGILSGTPTTGGNYNFTVTATDSSANSFTGTGSFSILVSPGITIPTQLPNGTYGATYTQTALAATGGIAPYTYALAAGSSLPSGLSVSSSGLISGTPTATGTFSFTVVATDHLATTGSQVYTISIATAPLTVTANAATMSYGGPLPTLSGALTGVAPGDGITATYSTIATVTSPVAGLYAVTPTLNDPNDKLANYTVTSTSASFTITPATLIVVANNASKVYGTANPSFTGKITGQQNGDNFTESFATTAVTSSPAGTYTILPTATGTNAINYTQSPTFGTLTVTQAGSTTALTVGSTSITPGQSVTLSAAVTSTTIGTPTGTISFYDGTTLLNAVALSGGSASLAVSTLASGVTHSLTAVYSGDSNFMGSNGASAVSVTVAPANFTLAAASGGTTSQTVQPGGTATYTFQVTPQYGVYGGPVAFTVTGLPTGATATFSPAVLAANSGTQTVTLTIQTASTVAQLEHRGTLFGESLALLVLPLFALKRRRGFERLVCLLLCMAAGALALTGCSSSGQTVSSSGSTPQTYTVTVTGTSGGVQSSFNVTLNVQ